MIEDSDDEEIAETTPQRKRRAGLSDSNANESINPGHSPNRSNEPQSAGPSTASTGLYSSLASSTRKLIMYRITQSRDPCCTQESN